MREDGLQKIDSYVKTGKVEWEPEASTQSQVKKEFHLPEFILNEFADNEPALTNFNNLALTYQRHYVLWITAAKREGTIKNRLKNSVELLKENKKLGLK